MIKNKLASLLNIRPDEGLATVLLFLNSFFIGISRLYLGTASYALFLDKFDVQTMPLVYIISALANTFVGIVYSRFEERMSFSKLMISIIGVSVALLLFFYVSMLLSISKATVMGLIICYNVLAVLVELEFWGLAGRLFNVRQGKRLYGIVGSGALVAAIIGGFSVSMLVEKIGTSNLLLISAIGMMFALIVLVYITRIFERQLSSLDEDIKEEEKRKLSDFFKSRYLLLVFSLAATSTFGYYFMDYVFYDQVESYHQDDPAKVASFLGIFFAAYRVVTLICNALVYSRLMGSHHGLAIALLIVPIVVALGSAGFAGVMNFSPEAAILLFSLIIGTRLFDEVLRVSIEEPSMRILYQPLPQSQRMKAQTVVETMVEPLASALAGVILLGLTSALSLKPIHIIYILLVIIIFWMIIAFLARNEYTAVLTNAITKRKLGGSSFSMDDASSKAVLEKWLKSENPGDVIYSLNMLEELRYSNLESHMINLLDHQAPEVRKHVLEKIRERAMKAPLQVLRKRLRDEDSPDVKGAALQTLCAIYETEAFDQVSSYLGHADVGIRKGAMIGMLRNVGLEGVMAAGVNLKALIASTDPQERGLAAQVLGEVGISSFYRPLLDLLKDENHEVRKAAIAASGKLKNPKMLPLLLENLSVPKMRQEAIKAVIAFGEEVIPELDAAYEKEGQARYIRMPIIRIWGRIRGEKAIEVLKSKIDHAEEDIRSHLLAALVACKYHASGREVLAIQERIKAEIGDATWTLTTIFDIGSYEYASNLVDALKGEIKKNRKRIFLLLAMIYPPDPILSAQRSLDSASSEKKARSLEALDNIISLDIKRMIIDLIDDSIPWAQRHAKLLTYFHQERKNSHERLKDILRRSRKTTSSWTKACALFTIGRIGTKEFYDNAISALADPDPTVKETAVWAMGRLDPDDLGERLQKVVDENRERYPRVAEFARFVIHSVAFASIPMGKGYLTRSGQYTVDLFTSILMDEGERWVRRRRAAGILSRFKGNRARNVLLDALKIRDKPVLTAVLEALVKGKFDISGSSARENLTALLAAEIGDAKRILSTIVVLMPERHSDRLIEALNQEINNNRKRALSILILLSGDSSSLNLINYWYILQKERAVPGNVAEELRSLLAEVADKDLRKRAFTLFHQYRKTEHLKRIKELKALHTRQNMEHHLKEIAFGTSMFTLSWTRICALEMIANLNIRGCVPEIVEKLKKDSDNIVRATGVWALFKLDPGEFKKLSGRLRHDRHPLVSSTATQLENEMTAFEALTLKRDERFLEAANLTVAIKRSDLIAHNIELNSKSG